MHYWLDGLHAYQSSPLQASVTVVKLQCVCWNICCRLKLLWYGLVSERHDVRMYKDLLIAPKKVSTVSLLLV